MTSAARHAVRLIRRTEEFATLEREIRRALIGSCALIMVEGEAGLGKTRLLEELTDALAGARVGRATS